jgi:hypothetical protein
MDRSGFRTELEIVRKSRSAGESGGVISDDVNFSDLNSRVGRFCASSYHSIFGAVGMFSKATLP